MFPVDEHINGIARHFEQQAKIAYRGTSPVNSSPLYTHLALKVAEDSDILMLMLAADRYQPVSNLLFAAVHFLLLSGVQHPLVEFFASLTPTPRPPEEAYPAFRNFCLTHTDEIQRLVTTKRVQTNEVRRCACLMPVFELISQRANRMPLALVEIGSSAGFNLLWDKYFYDYGTVGQVGDPNALVKLSTSFQTTAHPPIPSNLPEVTYRIGVDLVPIDVRDDEAMRWPRALIWPEHRDRMQLFDNAVRVARENPPTILTGDALERLPDILSNMPYDTTPCVYHSFALNQIQRETREKVFGIMAQYSHERPVVHIAFEWYGNTPQPTLELFSYRDGAAQAELLAHCESHGRWLEWVVGSTLPM